MRVATTTRRDPVAFFWSKVEKSDAGCWEWRGSLMKNGYASFVHDSPRKVLAHRYSWMLHNGPIPAGLLICHHCDNRRCVRPDHLFLGTTLDNMRDMIAKGRSGSGHARHWTHCVRGHEFTPENTKVRYNKRRCLTCSREENRLAKKLARCWARMARCA